MQAELARLLLRDAKDPRLQRVTVTAVRMTPDLRVARVYFRTLGDAAAAEATQRALERASPFLRGEIGRSVRIGISRDAHDGCIGFRLVLGDTRPAITAA